MLVQPCPNQLLQVDLPLQPSSCLGPWGKAPRCPKGLLAHLPEVVAEYLAIRQLSPIKLLVRGPPGAGEQPGSLNVLIWQLGSLFLAWSRHSIYDIYIGWPEAEIFSIRHVPVYRMA
jgi:hypothetical protein